MTLEQEVRTLRLHNKILIEAMRHYAKANYWGGAYSHIGIFDKFIAPEMRHSTTGSAVANMALEVIGES